MIYFNFLDFLLLLVFGLVLPFLSGIQSHKGLQHLHFDAYTRKKFYLTNSLMLGGMAGVILCTWWWFDRSFSLMGFVRPQNSDTVTILIIATSFLYVSDLVYSILRSKSSSHTDPAIPFLPEKTGELPVYLIMCLSAAVFEEIVFRGFMVTYFIAPYSETFPWMAAFFPAFLFAIAHFYQGIVSVGKIFLLSSLFALIFIFSGSLIYVMLLHFMIDLIGGIASLYAPKKNAPLSGEHEVKK